MAIAVPAEADAVPAGPLPAPAGNAVGAAPVACCASTQTTIQSRRLVRPRRPFGLEAVPCRTAGGRQEVRLGEWVGSVVVAAYAPPVGEAGGAAPAACCAPTRTATQSRGQERPRRPLGLAPVLRRRAGGLQEGRLGDWADERDDDEDLGQAIALSLSAAC